MKPTSAQLEASRLFAIATREQEAKDAALFAAEEEKRAEYAAREAQFKAKIDADNRQRGAALERRLVVRQGKEGLEAVEEPTDSYTRFLQAQKKKADFDLESFSLVDTAMAAFDPKKAERLKQATERRNAVDAKLASALAPGNKETDRSVFDTISDNFKGVQATVYDMGASVADWMSPDVTGLEPKNSASELVPFSSEFGVYKDQIMAIEAADKALELMAKGRDAAAAWAGMDDKSAGILKALTGVDSLKEITSSKLADIRNKQVQENQRRAKEGLPSIEEENAAMLGNRYAEYARDEATKVRQDKTLEAKINDARLGIAAQKGMAEVAKYAWENPTQIVEKAIESAPYLAAGGPASSTLRALGFSKAVATTGGAVAIGGMDTAQGAQQAKDAVKTTNMAELAKSDAFKQLKAANPDATPAQLREVLSMAAEDRALGVGLPTNALLAVVSTKIGLNPVEAAASGAAKKTTALGAIGAMGKEAIGEFPEEAGNQWSQNLGEIAGGVRDPSKEGEGVAGAGTLGAFTGAATSGGMSVGTLAVDTASKESLRRDILKREAQANAQPAAPQAQPTAGATTQSAPQPTTTAETEVGDAPETLMPVRFFESKLDQMTAEQDAIVPEASNERRAFTDKAKQEYRNYLENGTPMSKETSDLLSSFVPAYKEASAPKSAEEVETGLRQLVSDVFALSQDSEGGQSLSGTNRRIMQRISGETNYQVLEKFADMQAEKAAFAADPGIAAVFMEESDAAYERAQELKSYLEAPVAPTAPEPVEEDTIQPEAPVVETAPTPTQQRSPSERSTEPPVSYAVVLEERARQERERAEQEAPAKVPDGKFGSGIVYRVNLDEQAPVTETTAPTEKNTKPLDTDSANTAYEKATKEAMAAEGRRKTAQTEFEKREKEVNKAVRDLKRNVKGKAQTLMNMLGKKRLFTAEYSQQVGNSDNFRVGGNWAHTNSTHTGMTLHQLREWMEENEFLPMDSYDDDALDLYQRAIRGEDIFNLENSSDAAQERENDMLEREAQDDLLRQKQALSDLVAEETAAKQRRESAWQDLKKVRSQERAQAKEEQESDTLQSATSATDGSVTSPKPTAKKFKDMSLFEQWAVAEQLRDTTSSAELDSILAGIASGGIMLRNDPTSSAEASITRVGKKIVINLAQFTGKNLKQRRADSKKLRKQANSSLTLKDRLSRKAKKEKLQAFYLTNFTSLVQSSTSFVDALRHEMTHAKDMMSNVDMEAVNEMMANNPLWAASAAFVEANPATVNMSRNDKLLETNGYYMTALSTMASNPQYAPLLATFEESVYAPMKELTSFMTSDELLQHWASVLDSNSRTGTMQSATGRTLTLPQANRNKRFKALMDQKITSTELPEGPKPAMRADAVVDTSPRAPDRTKSVGLQLGMLLDARDAVEGKTKSEAVAALRALRDSEDVLEPHEANILAGIAEDNYASRFIMEASSGMSGDAKMDYTMLLSDLLNDRDVALSSMMSLPVFTNNPSNEELAPLWAASYKLRSRLLGAVGGIASVAEMGEAYRSDIRVSDQENNNPNIFPASIGSIVPSVKDGMLLKGTEESIQVAVKSIAAAARAKVQQHRNLVVTTAKKLTKSKISKLSTLVNKSTAAIKILDAEIAKLNTLKEKRDEFIAGLKKEPTRLSKVFDKLDNLPELAKARDEAAALRKERKVEMDAAIRRMEVLDEVLAGSEINTAIADDIITAYNSVGKDARRIAYEFRNAVELDARGETAASEGPAKAKAFLNSVYVTVSNPDQGIEAYRVFVSEEQAATDKNLVSSNGKYYDFAKILESLVKADGLKPKNVKGPVYMRYVFDSLLAVSSANGNAPVLPSYSDSYGRRLLHGKFDKVEYLDRWTGQMVTSEDGYIAFSQESSDALYDQDFLALYKAAALESAVAAKPMGESQETNVFTLAEEKGTDLKNLDDVLNGEVEELTALRDNIEAVLDRVKDKDYEKEYEAYFPEKEDGKKLSKREEQKAEEKRKSSWWWMAGIEILLIPGISEVLDLTDDQYRGIRNEDDTASAATFEATWSALDSLQENMQEIERQLEVVSNQNEIVRKMGYDFDSGNLSESYDFDVADANFNAEYGVGRPRMEGKYEYDPTDGTWKKKEDIAKQKVDYDNEDKAYRSRRSKRADELAKRRRSAAVSKLVRPVLDLDSLMERQDAVYEAFRSDYVVRRQALNDYLNNTAGVEDSYFYSENTPMPWLEPDAQAEELRSSRERQRKLYEEEERVRSASIEAVPKPGVSQGQLFSATGSFSGIFRNIHARVAADDVNALTAMLADRATVSSIKIGAQNNAFIGPFARNFVKRDTHSAIATFKLRVDGLMAKNTAVIGGKVARMNREMDNLGIPQRERTELLNLLVALDETYTVQSMKAISKTALVNRYKRLYGNEVQAVFDMADELRQEVDSAIEKLAKATLGQYTYGTAPKKVKDAYDALIASKQRYLHRTYHKFSISSGRLWKAQIDNAIDAIKKYGPTAAANSSSHSAKAHAAVLNAAYTVVNSWDAFTARGTPIEHAFKQVAPGWKTMNNEVKLRLVLDMFQEDFMAAAELEITNGSINSISPASKNAGALKAKRLDGPQNKVFREMLGENRDYGRVISETIENQTVITMHLEMMRQLQHMGLLIDKNTFDGMTVAQRDAFTQVPSAGIFSAFSSSYILKDFEYAVTVPIPKESIGKSIRDFNQAVKKGDYKGMGQSAMTGSYNAIATTFGLLKMFTVFTSPNLWASLFVGMASFSAKAAANPAQLVRAYQIAAMWKANQAGAPIDPNDPIYNDYMFIMGSETIDSAVFAELTTRAKDSDYEAALAQLDTNGRLIRDMGFKTAENIKDYLIATWTKYEAAPKIAAALAHRDNMNAYNRALGKRDVSPAFVGNIVRREFPSAKDVPALAKFSDSIGMTMFAGFYYQTIKAGSWGIAQNLNEGLQMYRKAGGNSDAQAAAGKFIARIIGGSALQFATIVGLTYMLKALFTMDDDDMDEEQRKLKKAAEATLYTTENPDNLMHIGFHEDGTPLFVDVTMMVNPLDVRDTLFRRAIDSMSAENKETLSDVLVDQIPYGFVGQSIRNYIRGVAPDKNAAKAYDRLTNAGILRYVNNLNENGVAPGEAGAIAGALANISGIKKVDPSARIAQMGYQVFFANEDLSERVKDVIYDGDSYNKSQMRDQVEDELDYVGMKARVYFDTTNDAFKRSGMTRSEFISAMTKSLPEDKAKMFAKDLGKALVDEGDNYAEERASYSAKQIASYYNREVKKGLLSTEKGGPLFNASSYEVAAATRNKTSYEAIIDPTEPSAPVKATVTGVHDADTLYVTTDSGRQLKVRIQNIDAFELKQKLKDGSLDIGKEGQQYLSSLVNNKQVTLFGYGYDDNGRMIARVMTKDGRDAGTVVAEEGYAILTDISELESYPTKAEDMDAVAPSVYRERNK